MSMFYKQWIVENINKMFLFVYYIFGINALYLNIVKFNSFKIFSSTVALCLPLLYDLLMKYLKKKHNITVPKEVKLLTVVFILFALIFGVDMNFYAKYAHFDKVVHFISGVLITQIAFYIFYLYNRTSYKHKMFFLNSFAFSLNLSFATLWEGYEFYIFFNVDAFQKTLRIYIFDTAGDIFVSMLGSILIISIFYLYIKKGIKGPFTNMFKEFISLNSHHKTKEKKKLA